MDVSDILASHNQKLQSVIVEKETPLDIDAGLLTVTDLNPIDEDAYKHDLEEHLQNLARDGVQALIGALFSLPTKPSPDGPLAVLPPPIYQLPRAKPLPKPKPPTKWELFAKAKGIQKKRKDKKVWDEEKQEWVNRWGKDGKNKEKEVQWAEEVPVNADVDFDPRKEARDERKARIAKNKKQQEQNILRASGTTPAAGGSSASASSSTAPLSARKMEIDRTLATTRVSTASMGKYDRRLEGEKKLRGVKRKFDAAETSVEKEKEASLNLIKKMESDSKKMRPNPRDAEDPLNVRKAVRFASKGKGGAALGRDLNGGSSKKSSKAGKGKRR